MPQRSTRYASLLALFLCFAAAGDVLAQSLVITDCQGFTRASQAVEANEVVTVRVEVTDLAGVMAGDGVSATLTDQATGAVTQTVIRDGVATFESIPAGIHALEISDPNLVVATISTTTAAVGVVGAGLVIAGAGVAGGAAVTGGALLINEAVDQIDGSDSNDEAAPVPTVVPTPEPEPSRVPTPRPTVRPTPDDCPQCDPDLEPPPLPSPFPPDQLPARSRADDRTPSMAASRRLSPHD